MYPSFWAPIKSDDLGGVVPEYFLRDFVGFERRPTCGAQHGARPTAPEGEAGHLTVLNAATSCVLGDVRLLALP